MNSTTTWVYDNADEEDGRTPNHEDISYRTLLSPSYASDTYEELINESIDEKIAEFVELPPEPDRQASLIDFSEAITHLNSRLKETHEERARTAALRAEALSQAKAQAVDGLLTTLTGVLSEVMMEEDTPDWTRELIQRRYNRAMATEVSMNVTYPGGDTEVLNVKYIGMGQYLVNGGPEEANDDE